MNVIKIKNIIKKDIPLHYREEFSGLAVLDDMRSKKSESKIEFSLEQTAFGTKHVEIKFLKTPDYPVIPAIRTLREFILKLEKEGKLH
ncbi:MAG: hypothetical protein KAR21_02040 [Spirochaetales bacterium]|nr:hypothetical protein [Spirochaetales bacterium]